MTVSGVVVGGVEAAVPVCDLVKSDESACVVVGSCGWTEVWCADSVCAVDAWVSVVCTVEEGVADAAAVNAGATSYER